VQRQAGFEFAWREEITDLPSPAFRRVDVFVYEPPEQSRVLAHLTGFLLYTPQAAR
jgi:general secretion pathway protein I